MYVVCKKLKLNYKTNNSFVYDLRGEVIVRFVDIGGMVDIYLSIRYSFMIYS